VALVGRTTAGLRKFRAVEAGSAVALVAPASPFKREAFDAGCRELERLGLRPVFDETVFAEGAIVAGPPRLRATAFERAWSSADTGAVIAVRGGYGSMEILPLLDPDVIRRRPLPFVGYSDNTSLHLWLNGHLGVTSVHGPMIEGRLAEGEEAYDAGTFLASLGDAPIGELSPDGLDVLRSGEATGPIVGGTLTEICSSLGTPFDFRPPEGAVVFIDEIGERPYRVRRMLEQLRQSGRLARVSALVFGQLPRCDESDGRVTARTVVAEFVEDVAIPVLFGFPSGHTTTPLVTLPFGVEARVLATARPRLVLTEAAGA
jgi:muramoyltetrapeptide carboxypeptidase